MADRQSCVYSEYWSMASSKAVRTQNNGMWQVAKLCILRTMVCGK